MIFSLDKLGPGTVVNVVESGYCLDRDDLNSLVGCAAGCREALTLLMFHLEQGVTCGEVPAE